MAKPGRPQRVTPASCGPSGSCFTAGTLVATSSGLKPIESLKVGERVLTAHAESLPTQVDPATWRKVSLLLPNDDGSPDVLVMDVLWPQTKIAQLGVAPGKAVPLAIEELHVEGTATVTAVEPCPPLASGPGRVVVATINHLNGHVLELDLKGLDAPLEATKEHPFYSLDRDAWVPAGRLKVGERLATAGGETTLTGVRRKPGTHRVYNLTVEYEHLYCVSEIGLLSHNAKICDGQNEGAKRGPKTDPNAPHNAKIRSEADKLVADGNKIVSGGGREKELLIKTPGGHKEGRRPDIIYKTPEGDLRGLNVGKTKVDGSPVTREQKALEDLNGPGKFPTDFVPYDR